MIAQMFNNYLTAKLVIMANQIGFFEALEDDESITAEELTQKFNMDETGGKDLLRFLVSQKVLNKAGDKYYLDKEFAGEFRQNFGMLSWLLEGYGNVIEKSHPILTGEMRYGPDIVRDAQKMASATTQISQQNTDSYMFGLLEKLDFTQAIDIGCGSGLRLLQLAERFKDVKLSGIDISEECCALARENIATHGRSEQINVVCSSAEDWSNNITETRSESGRNLVMCFAMFHDLLNVPGAAERMMASIKKNYPVGTYVLIQDQMCDHNTRVATADWVEGFTFVHRLMGQSLYTLDVYHRTIKEQGFNIIETVSTSIPENYLILAELVE